MRLICLFILSAAYPRIIVRHYARVPPMKPLRTNRAINFWIIAKFVSLQFYSYPKLATAFTANSSAIRIYGFHFISCRNLYLSSHQLIYYYSKFHWREKKWATWLLPVILTLLKCGCDILIESCTRTSTTGFTWAANYKAIPEMSTKFIPKSFICSHRCNSS